MASVPELGLCPVCQGRSPSRYHRDASTGETLWIECGDCGFYALSGERELLDELGRLTRPDRTRLMRALRQRRGLEPVTIMRESVADLIASMPAVPPSERRRRLLQWFADRTVAPGEDIYLGALDVDWLDLGFISARESEIWLRRLHEERLIEPPGSHSRLTPQGILACEELASRRHDVKQVFVAMSFGSTSDARERAVALYADGISRGINLAGLVARRIDHVESNNRVCDEMIVEIRRSRALVADLTHNRPNVYYEAGFAHGVGVPVVFTCQASAFEPQFDTLQYQTILWNEPAELAPKLANRLRATLNTDALSA